MTDHAALPPDPDLSPTEFADLDNGVRLAYVCEGVGGIPLLLVHGYPETKRIWWRNLMPLAEAGFEVIAPDLRGHGESSLARDGFYDIAAFSKDMYALVHDVLGHEHCFVAGGDVGGPVIYDLSLRYPGFVRKLCFFNTVPPILDGDYAAAGIPPDAPQALRSTADYFIRQATDPDGLLKELDTPERRRAYVAEMYGHRLWAGRGAFTPQDVDFMTEPYADADKLRASWGVYESSTGNRAMSDAPRFLEPNPLPTLVLYGPEDHVIPGSFPDRCKVAFTDCIGPLEVAGVGHFLQWEAADIFNRVVTHVFL